MFRVPVCAKLLISIIYINIQKQLCNFVAPCPSHIIHNKFHQNPMKTEEEEICSKILKIDLPGNRNFKMEILTLFYSFNAASSKEFHKEGQQL